MLRQIGVRLSSSYKYINSIFGPPLLPMRQVLPWKTSYLMCNICQLRNKLSFSLPTNIYSLHNFFLSSSHLLTLKSKFETVGWSKGTVFFTYKPSDFFSIWHKRLRDFFTRNGVRLIAEGLGFKKKSTNLPLMQNDHKFCDCSALFFLLCIFH